jgi:hypothetical protein
MRGQGIWYDGVVSKEEIELLQRLLRVAITRAKMGTLPYIYEDNKISFKAWLVGNTLHTFYGWKFPPKKLWSKEVKGPEECLKCLPEGPDGQALREVWCHKIGYNERKCPYGVPTE